MRVALITPSFYPATVYGGPIFSTLHTSEELVKLNNVEVFVSTTNANMTSRLEIEVDKWQKFDEHFFVKYYNETKVNVLSLSLLFNLWKDIKNTDVLHVQYTFSTPTPIALCYAKFFKKPVLFSPRGALCKWCLNQGSKFKKIWLRFLIAPFANRIFWHATSKEEKIDILTQFPSAKVETIPNGIEFDKFQIYSKLSGSEFCKRFTGKELNVEQVVISIGRLYKVKGFDILIDAFARIINYYPKAKLFIAGPDEGEKDNLIRQIQRLKLEEYIFLIGTIHGKDKIDFLANADLFVLSSHTENFGNVYVESLAAGTPIVASKGTPWAEVETADCGKWVNNNVNDTSQAILEMLKKDREQMRINSKKHAKNYNWENIAVQFKNVFEKMI